MRSPTVALALAAVKRIDALFDLGRAIDGLPADQRPATRMPGAAPLVASLQTGHAPDDRRAGQTLETCPHGQGDAPHAAAPVAFARILADARICLTHNVAERSLRGIAPWPTGVALRRLRAQRPVLARMANRPMSRLGALLCRNRTPSASRSIPAAHALALPNVNP